jgi:hypothetical protein
VNLTDQMRQAADLLEMISRLSGWQEPSRGEWSAAQLRKEADYLDKPVEYDSDNETVPPEAELVHKPNTKTFAEKLDAAQSGEEFGAVLNELFIAAFDKSVKP